VFQFARPEVGHMDPHFRRYTPVIDGAPPNLAGTSAPPLHPATSSQPRVAISCTPPYLAYTTPLTGLLGSKGRRASCTTATCGNDEATCCSSCTPTPSPSHGAARPSHSRMDFNNSSSAAPNSRLQARKMTCMSDRKVVGRGMAVVRCRSCTVEVPPSLMKLHRQFYHAREGRVVETITLEEEEASGLVDMVVDNSDRDEVIEIEDDDEVIELEDDDSNEVENITKDVKEGAEVAEDEMSEEDDDESSVRPSMASWTTRLPTPAGSKAKRFRCLKQGCGYSAAQKYQLADHGRAQHGHPKLVCEEPDCDEEFGSSSGLRRHKKAVHQGLRLKCGKPGCNYTAAQKRDLANHGRAKHGDPKLACRVAGCAREFVYDFFLSNHKKKHVV